MMMPYHYVEPVAIGPVKPMRKGKWLGNCPGCAMMISEFDREGRKLKCPRCECVLTKRMLKRPRAVTPSPASLRMHTSIQMANKGANASV